MDFEQFKIIMDILSSFCTSLAIITGGVWTYMLFIQRRQRYPRVEIKHEVIQKNLPNGKILFRAIITVKNTGDILVKMVSGEVRLLQVLPLTKGLEERLSDNKDLINSGESDIDWIQINSRQILSNECPLEIEPEEHENIICDFVIEDRIKSVQLYTYIPNEHKKHKGLGWNNITIHDIETLRQ